MQLLNTLKTMLLSAVLLLVSKNVLAHDYVFTNVNVIDMEQEQVLEGHAVAISDGRIVAVVPMEDFEVPDGAETIDARDQYLIPGLAEMHGHVPPMQSDSTPQRYLDDTLFLYLAGGITTVRGMLGHEDQLQLKRDVASGARLGPNLYLAGPSFSGNSIQSPEQAKDMVQQQAEAGWDLLKVHPGLELEEFVAMAEEADRQGIDFAGHIPQDVPLDRAMQLNIRTIDHIDGYLDFISATDREINDEEIQQLVDMTLRYEVGIVPTQALWATLIGAADHESLTQYEEIKYVPQSVRDGWNRQLEEVAESQYYTGDTARVHQQNRQRLLKALYDGGAEILMGTDAPQVYSVPGLGLKRELAMMLDAGLTPYEIIRTGTVNVGHYFSEEDLFGLVAEGHRADLVMTQENPLQNLETIYEPAGVMVRGRWLSRSMLDEKLTEIEAAYRSEQR